MTLKNFMSLVFGSFSLKAAISAEAKNRSGGAILSGLLCRIEMRQGNYDIRVLAKCSNEYRTGIGCSEIVLFRRDGFRSSDGALGFLAEQVSQAAESFPDIEFLLQKTTNYLDLYYFDVQSKCWSEVPPRHFHCSNCSGKKTLKGLQLLDLGDLVPLCPSCNSMMVEKH